MLTRQPSIDHWPSSFLDEVVAHLFPALLTSCPHRLRALLTRGPHCLDRLLEQRLQLLRSVFRLLLEITHRRSIKSLSIGRRNDIGLGLGFRISLSFVIPFVLSLPETGGKSKIIRKKIVVATIAAFPNRSFLVERKARFLKGIVRCA